MSFINDDDEVSTFIKEDIDPEIADNQKLIENFQQSEVFMGARNDVVMQGHCEKQGMMVGLQFYFLQIGNYEVEQCLMMVSILKH